MGDISGVVFGENCGKVRKTFIPIASGGGLVID